MYHLLVPSITGDLSNIFHAINHGGYGNDYFCLKHKSPVSRGEVIYDIKYVSHKIRITDIFGKPSLQTRIYSPTDGIFHEGLFYSFREKDLDKRHVPIDSPQRLSSYTTCFQILTKSKPFITPHSVYAEWFSSILHSRAFIDSILKDIGRQDDSWIDIVKREEEYFKSFSCPVVPSPEYNEWFDKIKRA